MARFEQSRVWVVAAVLGLAACERAADAPPTSDSGAAATASAASAASRTEGLPPVEPPASCLPGMACEPLPVFDWRDPAQWMGPSADRVSVEPAGGVRIDFNDRERPALVPHGQIAVAPGDVVTLTVTVSATDEQRVQMGIGRHPIDTPQERSRTTEQVGPEPQTFTYTHTFRHAHPSVRASFGLKGAYEGAVIVHDLTFAHQPAATTGN